MSVQVALTFPDFAAAQAFFAGAALNPKPEAVAHVEPAPAATVDPSFASAPPVVEAKPAGKPGRKPKASEPAPTAAQGTPTVPPLDVKNGDPLPASMQAEKSAESSVDPLEVPAFLKKAWTEDEVREVLKTVSAKHGLDAVRQLLVEVTGKSSISEVPAPDYLKLAEAANARVAA